MTRAPVDVLIVGAGPTGLALAAQLRRFGVRPRVIDRLPSRVHESRALAIQPRSLEVLDTLDIARTLVERGNNAVEVRLHTGRRVVAIPLFDLGLEDTEYPFLLFLSQAETEEALHEHLAERGVEVERGVELVDMVEDGESVVCRLSHGDGRPEEVRTAYLVGCDGAHSTVRHAAGIAFEGDAYPQTFALADLEVTGRLEDGSVHVYIGAAGMLFFFPLNHPASWRLQTMLPGSSGARERGEDTEVPSLAVLQAIVDSFTGGDLRLHEPVWRSRFRIHRRHAAAYRTGRVFLAGDAAHVHSPAGAQGMNTGIQDAWNLGWKLALVVRGRASPDLLDSYEAERWPIGESVLRMSDRPFRLATSESRLFRSLRKYGKYVLPATASLATRLDAPRAYVFRRLAQLDIRYRDSPVVQEGEPRPSGGPRAGDRLPDAALTREGRATSLHRELAGPGLHLLLCGPARAWGARRPAVSADPDGTVLEIHRITSAPEPGSLVDVRGEAFSRLGVGDAAHYLVRPDGHVAYRAGGTDLDQVSRYLARWFGGKPVARGS